MRAAPPLACTICRHVIGRRRGHNLIEGNRLVCTRCLLGRRDLHPDLFPECPDDGHDLHDHTTSTGSTRAGAARVLGVWP